MSNVTINLFEVKKSERTQRLSRTLEEYALLDLQQRLRDDVRLDYVFCHPPDQIVPHVSWDLNFAKGRVIGPGRMDRSLPVADIGLTAGQMFGEETTALYLPHRRWLLVLSNHYGVGPAKMGSYLNALDPGSSRHFDYSVQPMLDRTTVARMEQMQRISEVEIVASVGAFAGADDVTGESVLEAAQATGALRVSLKLVAHHKHGRGGRLNMAPIRQLIDHLLPQDDGIEKLSVRGGGDELERKDLAINLIEQKIKCTYPSRALLIEGNRYTFASKIDLLRRACRGWLETL